MSEVITIETTVNRPIERIWETWNEPRHIIHWGFASDDWHVPAAQNDLRVNGTFNYRMEAKDGSEGFDFSGVYTEIVPNKRIAYVLGDGRKVSIEFTEAGNATKINQSFEAENEYPPEYQKEGWQSILNNFKNYTETIEELKY